MFSSDLLEWFGRNQREMPWRTHRDPYWIWVSEAMLQQTQVATVIPYFLRFIDLFPSVEALASAELQSVLKAWEGLGYYSRARNLHRAAQTVVSDYCGNLPSDYAQLQTLPGFGPYIAAAVASIAFEVPVPVVDGNVLRVFSRYWGIEEDIRNSKVRNVVFDRLRLPISTVQPSQFNQAIMELGALVCTPKNPDCTACPLSRSCYAKTHNQVDRLPYKSTKPPIPHHVIGVGVIRKSGKVLIGRRKESQMLGGLWEFPGGKNEGGESISETIRREILEEVGVVVTVNEPIVIVKHAYTHFKITLHAYFCDWVQGDPVPNTVDELKWVVIDELGHYPFPKANGRVIDAIKTVEISKKEKGRA